MKLTVLVDNNTLVGYDYLGEPGLSFLIEDSGTRVLFDCGLSDALVRNAGKMAASLQGLDYIVFSHGHYDHAGGFLPLADSLRAANPGSEKPKLPTIVAHPLFFSERTEGGKQVGVPFGRMDIGRDFLLRLSTEPFWLSERLVFLGEIPRKNEFEAKSCTGKITNNGITLDDCVLDDSALAYKSPQGLVIIAGCSHAGACNIIEYAKQVCGESRVVDVIGGFHLQSPSRELLGSTIAYLSSAAPTAVHACHCTDLASKVALAGALNLKEVGSGLVLEYD